jgi:hypothetical protein
MKTILAVVARIIPTRVIHTPTQKYMTVEQARAELREAGIPDSFIDYTPTMDSKSPYDDPEADDAEMNDVAPNKAHLRPNEVEPPEETQRAGKSGHGRPPRMPNKISRTMKEAVIGAVELLGSTDIDEWDEIIKKAETDPDPYRRFFTIAAVRDLKIFMAVVGRIIPTHVIHSKQQRYMTVEAAKAELREAGIPESFIEHVPTYDINDVDPDEIVGRPSPYDDPEADEDEMVDVTPKQAAE